MDSSFLCPTTAQHWPQGRKEKWLKGWGVVRLRLHRAVLVVVSWLTPLRQQPPHSSGGQRHHYMQTFCNVQVVARVRPTRSPTRGKPNRHPMSQEGGRSVRYSLGGRVPVLDASPPNILHNNRWSKPSPPSTHRRRRS